MITHLSPLNGKYIRFKPGSIANHIKHYCKKTGEDFNKAKTTFFESVPKQFCPICGQECILHQNLEFRCASKKCRSQTGQPIKYKTSKRYFGDRAEDYILFILENIDFYLTNLKLNIRDPFDDHLDKFTLEKRLKRKLPAWKTDLRFFRAVQCESCLKFRSVNIFSVYHKTCSKKCATIGISRNRHDQFIKLFELSFGDITMMQELMTSDYKFSPGIIKRAKDKNLSELQILQLELIFKPNAKLVLMEDLLLIDVPGSFSSVWKKKQLSLLNRLDLFQEHSSCAICSGSFIKSKDNSRFCSAACYHISLKSENFTRFHSIENKLSATDKQSESMKNKILRGDFTPNITNSWTRGRIQYEINGVVFKFRSQWEAIFFLFNQHLVFEKTRIPYFDITGKRRTYITDFTDESLKIIYEIKPDGLRDGDLVKTKRKYAEEWCIDNDFSYVEISDSWYKNLCSFQENMDKILNVLGYNAYKAVKQFI